VGESGDVGVTYVVWKWRGAAGAGDVAGVVRALGADEDHPLVDRFDVKAFLKELRGAVRARGGLEFVAVGSSFSGSQSNSAVFDCGFEAGARLLPTLVEVAGRYGAVVFSHESGRLVSAAEAAAGLEAVLAYEADRAAALSTIRRRHEEVVRDVLTPAAKGVGFVKRKYWFERKEGDRVCHITYPLREWNSTLELTVCLGFRSLLDFMNAHQRYCQEAEQKNPTLDVRVNLGEVRPGGGRLVWKLDGSEEEFAIVRADVARSMTELGPMIFERYRDLSSLLVEWAGRADGWELIELAAVRWLLGDREGAKGVVRDRLAFVREEVKRRYFPPLISEKVDLEFFERFLDSLG
jgi:hypothetical protein